MGLLSTLGLTGEGSAVSRCRQNLKDRNQQAEDATEHSGQKAKQLQGPRKRVPGA